MTCGGGGAAGACGGTRGCVPQTCQSLNINCGPAGDGCGRRHRQLRDVHRLTAAAAAAASRVQECASERDREVVASRARAGQIVSVLDGRPRRPARPHPRVGPGSLLRLAADVLVGPVVALEGPVLLVVLEVPSGLQRVDRVLRQVARVGWPRPRPRAPAFARARSRCAPAARGGAGARGAGRGGAGRPWRGPTRCRPGPFARSAIRVWRSPDFGDVGAQEVRQIGAGRGAGRSAWARPRRPRLFSCCLEARELLAQRRDLVRSAALRGLEVRDLVLDAGDGCAGPLRLARSRRPPALRPGERRRWSRACAACRRARRTAATRPDASRSSTARRRSTRS